MTDYKRMVSYMYQYENGVKRKNVGYARIEAKNGQCKITLHMQLLGQLDSIFPTYLIQRDGNGMELIYLGDTVLKSQVMDSKLTADETNIKDSGYGLSDIGGILIFLNENVFFATEWDDKPIVAKEVLEAMKPKGKKPSVPKETENTEDKLSAVATGIINEKQSFIVDEVLSDKIEKDKVAEVPKADVREASILEEASIPVYKLPRGWKTVERLNNKGKETISAAVIQEATLSVDVPDQVLMDVNPVMEEPLGAMEQNMEENFTENGSETAEMAEHATAKHFFENYPRIYPFEDNEITLCVKIEPKDLGKLSKEVWALSNNSFLMHGYYCYHHLIFAKMKDRYGCRYILGIPGIYHNRERFMARMFGFEEFKSIRKRELQQGDFGYWYLQINF